MEGYLEFEISFLALTLTSSVTLPASLLTSQCFPHMQKKELLGPNHVQKTAWVWVHDMKRKKVYFNL